jgi:hypothetical protein
MHYYQQLKPALSSFMHLIKAMIVPTKKPRYSGALILYAIQPTILH